jgi:hypothetical protein
MRVVVEAAALRRIPSLEREPKTLSLHELNCARVRTRLTIPEYLSSDHPRDWMKLVIAFVIQLHLTDPLYISCRRQRCTS